MSSDRRRELKRTINPAGEAASSPASNLAAASFDSPLTQAFKDSGIPIESSAGILDAFRMFGQVCFARTAESQKSADFLRAGRTALLEGLAAKKGIHDISLSMVAATCHATFDSISAHKDTSTSDKKRVIEHWITNNTFGKALALFDFDAINFITNAAISFSSNASLETWERADWAFSKLAGPAPSQGPNASPTQSLDPGAVEAAAATQASALMERFGLPGIRISGFPSIETTQATLDSLAVSLAELARQAGIPEKAIGLGGWTIHANAYMDRASGYCSDALKTICLSPDNGWRTLAHEWFHAIDMQASKSAKLPEYGTTLAAETPAKTTKFRLSKPPAPELTASAANVMKAIRSAAPGADPALASIHAETIEQAVDRSTGGLYERFYMNRVSDGQEPAARKAYQSLCSKLFSNQAGIEDIAAWRKRFLGPKAELCKHYDAFVLAEREARNASIAEAPKASALHTFALLADKQLNAATGTDDWTGYSSSSLEMAARGFEGNCFVDTPDDIRRYLVDGRDNTLYWPVANERGAHREAYRNFLTHAVHAIAKAGDYPKDLFDPARDSTPIPATIEPKISDKLWAKRDKDAGAKIQTPSA